jgi:hypothetical protein
MSSLAKCLSRVGKLISPVEAKLLKQAAKERRAEGYTAEEADETVVSEVIADLEADLQRITEQTKAPGPTQAPEAPTPKAEPAVEPAPKVEAPAAPVVEEKPPVKEAATIPAAPAPAAQPTPALAAPVAQGTSFNLNTGAAQLPKSPAVTLPKPTGITLPKNTTPLQPGESVGPKPVAAGARAKAAAEVIKQAMAMPKVPGAAPKLPEGSTINPTTGGATLPKGPMTLGPGESMERSAPVATPKPTLAQDISTLQKDPNGRQFMANNGVSAPATMPKGVTMPAVQPPTPKPAAPAPPPAPAPAAPTPQPFTPTGFVTPAGAMQPLPPVAGAAPAAPAGGGKVTSASRNLLVKAAVLMRLRGQ